MGGPCVAKPLGVKLDLAGARGNVVVRNEGMDPHSSFHVNIIPIVVPTTPSLIPYQVAESHGGLGLRNEIAQDSRCMDDIRADEDAWQCPVCNNKLHDTEDTHHHTGCPDSR